MTTQTIQFESVSLSEVGSGAITAFLFSGATLAATLASIAENGTLKGRYTGTVEDIAAGEYRLVVKFNGYTVNEPDEVVTLLLAVGTYVAERPAALNSETLALINDLPTNAELTTALALSDDATLSAIAAEAVKTTAIQSDITTLLSRVTTTVVTLWANLTAMITGSGASAKYTTGALSNAPSGGGGGGSITQDDINEIIAGVQAVHLNITEAVENCGFSITSSDTWIQSVTGLGNLTDKKVTFTIKSDRRDVDSAAIVFLDEAIGLLYLNGAVTTTSWGSITIDDETAGNITLRLESDATHLIPTGKYIDAIKVIKDNADFSLRNAGTTTVLCGVIKEHS